MKRYVEAENRSQSTLFPESLDDYIAADNPVRVVDVFVDELDLKQLGFDGAEPEATGRPAYHPGTLLKIYIYGYLNRIQSSRRLERETQRNVELIWLTGRLSPDFKTIADFRKDNGKAIRRVCREFVVLCRSLNLFSEALWQRCSIFSELDRPAGKCGGGEWGLQHCAGARGDAR
jgi:transposase